MNWLIAARIVLVVALLFTWVASNGLPKKWRDDRTARAKQLRVWLNIAFLVVAGLTVVIWLAEQDAMKQQRVTNEGLLRGQKGMQDTVNTLRNEHASMRDSVNTLIVEEKTMQDSINTLLDLVRPILALAQQKYPDSTAQAAIFGLAAQIRQGMDQTEHRILSATQDMIQREDYRPLSNTDSEILVKRMKSFRVTSPTWPAEVTIECRDDGNGNRYRYAEDLYKTLTAAGFRVRQSNVLIFGRAGMSPLELRYDPSHSKEALEFLGALFPLFNCLVDTFPAPELDSTAVKLSIFGVPSYSPDGSIKLK